MSGARIDGLLCDMNGLFRRWRNVGASEGERIAGLPPGTLAAYATTTPRTAWQRLGSSPIRSGRTAWRLGSARTSARAR
jgi:hypothetical protein